MNIIDFVKGINFESALVRFIIMAMIGVVYGALVFSPVLRGISMAMIPVVGLKLTDDIKVTDD